jgi:hypothetical protein
MNNCINLEFSIVCNFLASCAFFSTDQNIFNIVQMTAYLVQYTNASIGGGVILLLLMQFMGQSCKINKSSINILPNGWSIRMLVDCY